jgi:hypothetical protein
MIRQICRPSRLWSNIACVAPMGAGGTYSEEAISGSHSAACFDNRRNASASRRENFAISAADFCGSRNSRSVEPSSNTDIIGDSGKMYSSP